jgi:hypothetical protein
MDENLQNIVLEGGGGPYGMESYELGLYFAARHTSIDCYEKRNKKGYLFMFGDEMAYPVIDNEDANQLIDAGLQTKIRLRDIIAEAKEKYHIFFFIPQETSGGRKAKISDFWKEHLGEQHVLPLEKISSVAETIAMVIGTNEGTIGLEDGFDDLREMGATEDTIETVNKALAVRPNTGSIAKSEGGSLGLGNDDGDDSGSTRL